MKRFIVVPLLLCAVALPAAAGARDASVEPTATAKGGGFHVAFRVIEQGGEPVAVKRLRFNGKGPRYIRISERVVRYPRRDVLAWMEQGGAEES